MGLEHGSGSNKSLVTHADGSASSKHSEVSLRAFDGSESGSSFGKNPPSVDDIGVIDDGGSVRPQQTHLDVVDESGSSKLEDVRVSDRNQSSTMQVSSSSSSLDSLVDHSQMDTNEVTKSEELDSGAQRTTKDDESRVSSGGSSISEEDDGRPAVSDEVDTSPAESELTFQVTDVTHESPLHGMASPPVQTMERPEGYDPFRIPSSVFESKSATPMEWSVASNESLFSLHVGNSSFSKDQFSTYADFKSGELAKSGEIVLFSPSPGSSVPLAGVEGNSLEPEEVSGAAAKMTEKSTKDETRLIPEGSSPKRLQPPLTAPSISTSHSHRSEGSETSARSFAFPIKKKKKSACACPSCYCFNCGCAFCHLIRWPSCHFRYFSWPSCYSPSCSWAFCYGWSCSKKRKSSHSSSVLPGVLKSESIRPENEKLHLEEVAAKKPSKSSNACSWFPCLSWNCSWRHCCCHCDCSCC